MPRRARAQYSGLAAIPLPPAGLEFQKFARSHIYPAANVSLNVILFQSVMSYPWCYLVAIVSKQLKRLCRCHLRIDSCISRKLTGRKSHWVINEVDWSHHLSEGPFPCWRRNRKLRQTYSWPHRLGCACSQGQQPSDRRLVLVTEHCD